MTEKISHQQAGYREFGTPEQHCLKCTMYRERDSENCTLVVDPVDWFGYCKFFELKRSA